MNNADETTVLWRILKTFFFLIRDDALRKEYEIGCSHCWSLGPGLKVFPENDNGMASPGVWEVQTVMAPVCGPGGDPSQEPGPGAVTAPGRPLGPQTAAPGSPCAQR